MGHLSFGSLMQGIGADLGKVPCIAALNSSVFPAVFGFGLTALAVFFLKPQGLAGKGEQPSCGAATAVGCG